MIARLAHVAVGRTLWSVPRGFDPFAELAYGELLTTANQDAPPHVFGVDGHELGALTSHWFDSDQVNSVPEMDSAGRIDVGRACDGRE